MTFQTAKLYNISNITKIGDKMYILAIDTTAKTASVCIAKVCEEEITPCSLWTTNCGFTHSETLLPMIDSCLGATGISTDNLEIIAVSAGPGSFTGVRIGVAAAKGISFGLAAKGIAHKCVEVSSIEALAENVKNYSEYVICPVMDARRSQFYNGLFGTENGKIKRLCNDRLSTAAELYNDINKKFVNQKILLVGDGAILCKKLFDKIAVESENKCNFEYTVCDSSDMYQNAYSVAKTAIFSQNVKNTDGARLSPIYLRASQAERERLARKKEKE